MNNFTIKGDHNFLSVTFSEVFGFPENTCHWGGYEIKSLIEIKSGPFYLKSIFYTSTGEIYNLFKELKQCNSNLTGTINYVSFEGNLELKINYDNLGHVNVKGTFSEQNDFNNELQFEFLTDQTFISSSLIELEKISDKYGDMKGIKKE